MRRLPTQRRALETTNAIVQAAEELLIEQGYASTSTNAIAARAGVSIGSLYQYFADKAAIYHAVVERHRQEVKPLIFRALTQMAHPSVDFVERTLELMRELARMNAKNPRLMAAIDSELGWLEHERDHEVDVSAMVGEILRARYTQPQHQFEIVSRLLVMTVSQLSRWLVHGKPPHLDSEAFVLAAGKMLRALLPD